MSRRLYFIHWNEREAKEMAQPLQHAGWDVEIESQDGARASRRILADPPQAVVISLARLPSHGRETASYLRSKLDPERLPIYFIDGRPDKVERLRESVPEATFTSSAALLGDLRELLDAG